MKLKILNMRFLTNQKIHNIFGAVGQNLNGTPKWART